MPTKRDYDRQYRLRHRERILASKRAYYRKHREEAMAAIARWQLAHPERVQQYQQTSLERHRDRNAIKRAERRNARQARPVFTVDEWRTLKAKYDLRCLRCGQQEPRIRLSPDHVVPIFHGGGNTIDNIQPLCVMCNTKKRTKIRDYRLDIVEI